MAIIEKITAENKSNKASKQLKFKIKSMKF